MTTLLHILFSVSIVTLCVIVIQMCKENARLHGEILVTQLSLKRIDETFMKRTEILREENSNIMGTINCLNRKTEALCKQNQEEKLK